MAHTQSQACCNVPAVVTHDYKPKGSFTEIQGMKTYTVGPKSAKQAILIVYGESVWPNGATMVLTTFH